MMPLVPVISSMTHPQTIMPSGDTIWGREKRTPIALRFENRVGKKMMRRGPNMAPTNLGFKPKKCVIVPRAVATNSAHSFWLISRGQNERTRVVGSSPFGAAHDLKTRPIV